MEFGKNSSAKQHGIKFQIKLYTQRFIDFFNTKSHYETIAIKAFCLFLKPVSSRINKEYWKETHVSAKITLGGLSCCLFCMFK